REHATPPLHDALPIWRRGEAAYLDAFSRQRRQPQFLDLADLRGVLGRTLVHRRHQARIRDVNDVLLIVEDVLRRVLVDSSLAAEDRKSTRLNSSHVSI